METIYTSGQYLDRTQTWHTEDSPWKASQIAGIIDRNRLRPRSIAEIGCGAGAILEALSQRSEFQSVRFSGYDISPQAIGLAQTRAGANLDFFQRDLLAASPSERFDVLLVIDVFEHVADYMGFLERCRTRADYKVFHIPLDLHVSSVLRNAFIRNRYTIGHLHYFTEDSALATLRDTGYDIVDYCHTNAALDLFRVHPSARRLAANIPRWLISRVSKQFSARLLGGYSLLVLAR